MKQSNQKLKLMYLAKILFDQTDEENTMTVPEMITELSKLGISAERKSVYDDIENLKLYGLDICSVKSKSTGYFVASREFELPELKLLVDSVQSAKFITHKKSMELISKIEKLTSRENAKRLHRQVFVTNRVKTFNEQIYYNVDKIYDAIAANKQITFMYYDLDTKKNKVYRKNGERYTESPVALTWDDENYYLITYKEKYGKYVHYRVDKMESIKICGVARVLPEGEFDLSTYSKAVFKMFNGEETEVTVRFADKLVGVVFDRFGTDIPIIKTDAGYFTCRLKVAVSRQFLSWIVSFGEDAKILAPQSVADELRDLVSSIAGMYEGK